MRKAPAPPAPLVDRPAGPASLLRWLLVSAVLLAIVVGLAFGAIALLRRAAMGDAAAALATMSQPRPAPPAGENGYAHLYRYDFDLPAERADAALAEAVAWHESFWPLAYEDSTVATTNPEDALTRRPKLEPSQLCPTTGCLDWVKEHRDEVRALVDTEADRIAATERGWTAASVRNPFPAGLYRPQPPWQSARLLLLAAAWDAVDGRPDRAYARTCGLLGGARRLSEDPGDLIEKMIGVAFARGAATLLLDLRREHPVATLPAECAGALAAPVDAETSLCAAIRGEFRSLAVSGESVAAELRRKPWGSRAFMWLLMDDTLQDAWYAETRAGWCHPDTLAAARRSELDRAHLGKSPVQMYSLRCFAAYMSCIFANIAAPADQDYALRTFDELAQRQLLLAAQRVADGEGAPREVVGDEIRPGYPVMWDERGMRATIRLQMPKGGPETWTLDFAGLAPAPPGTAPQPE